jgi:hypothetical protein
MVKQEVNDDATDEEEGNSNEKKRFQASTALHI